MAQPIDIIRHRPDRSRFPGQSLLTFALPGAALALVLAVARSDDAPGTAASDRPAAQSSREDHDSPVGSVAYSPDGKSLASATMAGEVRLRDLATGRSARLQRGPVRSALSLAFSA